MLHLSSAPDKIFGAESKKIKQNGLEQKTWNYT